MNYSNEDKLDTSAFAWCNRKEEPEEDHFKLNEVLTLVNLICLICTIVTVIVYVLQKRKEI